MDYITLKQGILAFFTDLGFTLDKIIPLALAVWIIYLIINKKVAPIKKIEAFIIRLCGALESGGDIRGIELYSNRSPLRITPKGMEIIEKIGFKKVIDDNSELLFKNIDRLEPKSALDVESICIGIIRYLMVDQKSNIFKEVEDFLYNNPTYNNPEFFKAGGLYLRDKYLEKHPELLPK